MRIPHQRLLWKIEVHARTFLFDVLLLPMLWELLHSSEPQKGKAGGYLVPFDLSCVLCLCSARACVRIYAALCVVTDYGGWLLKSIDIRQLIFVFKHG